MPPPSPTLVVACGALTRELRSVESQLKVAFDWAWLPAPLHNRPESIVGKIKRVLAERRRPGQRVLIGYGDCGTGGGLDELCLDQGLDRLPGDHCYEFFAGSDRFAELADEELGTFYLTDFLARHSEQLVFGGLGLNDHPELLEMYFGNYRRVVLLSQSADPEIALTAAGVADRLGLAFEAVETGLGPIRRAVSVSLGRSSPSSDPVGAL